MKKTKLFLLLSLLMLMTCLFAISAAADEPAATKIEGHNLALEENVQIVYYVDETVPEGAESGILFWLEPQTEYVYGTETYKVTEPFGTIVHPTTGHTCQKYAFTELSAKMMTVDVYAVSYVKDGETITYSTLDKYSILQYCFNKKDSETVMQGGTATLGDLVAATLEQGATAQQYFGYKTDRLANDTYYQVIVVGGALPDGTEKGLYKEGNTISLSAEIIKDQDIFAYWQNSAKEKVGASAKQLVSCATGNEIYQAVYSKHYETEDPYSFTYRSNGDGTCSIIGVNQDQNIEEDFSLIFPDQSPDGETVTDIDLLLLPDGILKNGGVLPYCISVDRYEEKILQPIQAKIEEGMLSSSEKFRFLQFQSYFIKKDLELAGTESERKEMLERYPILTEFPIYVLDTQISDKEYSMLSEFISKWTDYTAEDAIFDLATVLHLLPSDITGDHIISVTFPSMLRTISFGGVGCGLLKNVQTVIVPESVTRIRNDVFRDCSGLTSITFGENSNLKSIENYAFQNCTGLTSITIPDSVTSIGNSAFQNCTGLTSITVAEENLNYCSVDGILYNKAKTQFIHIPKAIQGNITIPDSVTSIWNQAFYGCTGLTSITIPDSVTSIGDGAFSGCSGLTSITVAEGNPVYHSAGNCIIRTESEVLIAGCQNSIIPTDGSVTSIGNSAFRGCTGLTSVTIPDSVTSIWNQAFYGCTGLTSIIFQGTQEQWNAISKGSSWNYNTGSYTMTFQSADPILAFTSNGDGTCYVSGISTCTDTDIVIPPVSPDGDSVTSIGEYAFYGCTGLTSITIPNSVTSIDNYAFYGCTGLTSITIPDSVTWLGDSAFFGCTGLTSITVAEGNPVYHSAGNCLIETESGALIAGCKNSIIPTDGSVTSIGYSAFDGCTGLTSITIPDSVTSIGNCAFYGCRGLTSITIPDSVTWLGNYAFSNCTGLTSITVAEGNPVYHSAGNCLIETESKTLIAGCRNSIIPTDGSVTSIGAHAFSGCTGLTSITIPDSVTSIGDGAFEGCSGLTSITIPDNVTRIEGSTFGNCIGLTSITFQGTKEQWNAIGKGSLWNGYTGNYTITCTDGTIPKE